MKNFLNNIDVNELELYLAKMGERETDSTSIDAGKLGISTAEVNEGVWLPDDDQAVKDLTDGKVDSELIKMMTHKKNKMNESWSAGEWLEEMNMPAPHTPGKSTCWSSYQKFSVMRKLYENENYRRWG
ncbi:hypothetical protein PF008_g29009 [Phytophthora fragariae]|uniref:Uncharacterized protein n=2 Tax=Phytophthora fragariae TaxID=53985 RepID=A0A6G0Q9R2_9STRA|nr:hypothetical protein PF008_g29009 [Phytophthora fragariae]